MVRTQGLTHVHLVVNDLDRSLRFYTEVFGMEEQFRDGPTLVFLRTPGSNDSITLNEQQHAAALGPGGIDHIGFRLVDKTDLDDAIVAVERAGGTLVERGTHPSGQPFAYVVDPDGHRIEL
jgi:catechol 2,3-dioxygenase-like lactoylglutathione lyase family enzyme